MHPHPTPEESAGHGDRVGGDPGVEEEGVPDEGKDHPALGLDEDPLHEGPLQAAEQAGSGPRPGGPVYLTFKA